LKIDARDYEMARRSADATLNSMLAFLTAGFRAPQRGNGSIVAGGITAGEIVKL
jgi:hypothetical protein